MSEEGEIVEDDDDDELEANEAGDPPPPTPERQQAEAFARYLFDGLSGAVNLRAVQEPKPTQGKPGARNWWYPIDENLPGVIGDYVEWCAKNNFAAFLVPFAVEQQTRDETGLLETQVFAIDVDKGAIEENCEKLAGLLGAPLLTVFSGGHEGGQLKRHLWYRLSAPAARADFASLAEIKVRAAAIIGGDSTVAKNLGQPMRIPGSLHQKGIVQLCRIASASGSAGLSLVDYANRLGVPAPGRERLFDLNLSAVAPGVDLARVLTQPMLAEGKSEDGLTRFAGAGSAIGHFIRNMRSPAVGWGEAEARQAARDWNAAQMVPPWDDARLMGDFDRLLRRDMERNGAMPTTPSAPTSGPLKLSDWSMAKYAGAAPTPRWLVDRVFPLGDAGILAGDGGIGKSFLALDLCCRVAAFRPTAYAVFDLNRREIFGGHISEGGSAVFITAEESKAALHRRLETLDPYSQRDDLAERLFVIPLRELGGGGSFIGGRNQGYPMTDYARTMVAELKTKPDLKLVVLDPLSVFYGAEGNDRTAVQAFANVLNHMASETGATIIALHHMRKDSEGSARRNILGSSGFVDAFRFSYTLQKVAPKEEKAFAADYGLDPDHGELVIGALVKTNGAAEGMDHLYERQPNGVLFQRPSRIDIAKAARDEQRAMLVTAADWYAEYGQPFTRTGKGSGLWVNKQALPPALRELSHRRLEALADEALSLGELQVAGAGTEKRQSWLCKPGSKVASGLLRDFTPGARPAWEARDLG